MSRTWALPVVLPVLLVCTALAAPQGASEISTEPVRPSPVAAATFFTTANASEAPALLNGTTVNDDVTFQGSGNVTVAGATFNRLYVAGSFNLTLVDCSLGTLAQVYEHATLSLNNFSTNQYAKVEAGGWTKLEVRDSSVHELRALGFSFADVANSTFEVLEYRLAFDSPGTIDGSVVSGAPTSNLVEEGVTARERRFVVSVGSSSLSVGSAVVTDLNVTGASQVEVHASVLRGTVQVAGTSVLNVTSSVLSDRLYAWDDSVVRLLDSNRESSTSDVRIYAYQNSTLIVRGGHYDYLYCLGNSRATLQGAIFDYHCTGGSSKLELDGASSVGADVCGDDTPKFSWDGFYLGLSVVVVLTTLSYVAAHEAVKYRRRHKTWGKPVESSGVRRAAGRRSTVGSDAKRALSPKCPTCGEPLQTGPFNQCARCSRSFCPSCSLMVAKGTSKCPHCGYAPERGDFRD
ncbi:MAG: hypothetical protein Kow0069_07110 [Promethearchaeota archaeon]